jgi:hypothetical protein
MIYYDFPHTTGTQLWITKESARNAHAIVDVGLVCDIFVEIEISENLRPLKDPMIGH